MARTKNPIGVSYLNPFTKTYVQKCRYKKSIEQFISFREWFLEEAETYLPDVWSRCRNNTGKCLHCGRDLEMHKQAWNFSKFCSFSCSTKWYADNTDRPQRAMKTMKQRMSEDPEFRLLPSQIAYWVKKGYNEEDAKTRVTKRQTTFNLQICIEKHGEIEGTKVWLERQNKWQKTLINLPLEDRIAILRKKAKKTEKYKFASKFISEIETALERPLVYGNSDLEKPIIVNDRIFLVDCFDESTNKIIEIYGDLFHFNPEFYGPDEYNNYYKISAAEKWLEDEERISLIRTIHPVLIVWEKNIRENRLKCINQCINYLNS